MINAYKFNGQELQDELGLNLYDMDLRDYDPAIARWTGIDPVTHHSQSCYNAFDGNPVLIADPSGADGVGGSTSYSSFGMSYDSPNSSGRNDGYSISGAFGDATKQYGPSWGDGTILPWGQSVLAARLSNIGNDNQKSTISVGELIYLDSSQENNIDFVELFEKMLSNKVGTSLTSAEIIKKYNLPDKLKGAINSMKLMSKNEVYVDWNNEAKINLVSKINVKDGILSVERGFIPVTPGNKKEGYNGYIIRGQGLNYQPSILSSEIFSPVFVQRNGIYGYFPKTNTRTKDGAAL